jgi:hypothetical protein
MPRTLKRLVFAFALATAAIAAGCTNTAPQASLSAHG